MRIDKGNPGSEYESQKVDHVIVRSGGRVLGRDGQPVEGSIVQNHGDAHIPLSEWLKWRKWNSPNGVEK